MNEFMEVPVEDVQVGDVFISGGRSYWTATSKPELVDTEHGKLVRIQVMFPDGGFEARHWDPGTILGVERR